MNIIMSEPYNYELVKENDGFYINIMCGSSSLFEVKVVISAKDSEEFINNKGKLNNFLKQVRDNPELYIHR